MSTASSLMLWRNVIRLAEGEPSKALRASPETWWCPGSKRAKALGRAENRTGQEGIGRQKQRSIDIGDRRPSLPLRQGSVFNPIRFNQRWRSANPSLTPTHQRTTSQKVFSNFGPQASKKWRWRPRGSSPRGIASLAFYKAVLCVVNGCCTKIVYLTHHGLFFSRTGRVEHLLCSLTRRALFQINLPIERSISWSELWNFLLWASIELLIPYKWNSIIKYKKKILWASNHMVIRPGLQLYMWNVDIL